jgi:beta-galactosidase
MKKIDTIRIPKLQTDSVILEILVSALGRNNYGDRMLVEKNGITEYVSFEPFTQMNWEVFPLPMNNKYLNAIKFGTAGAGNKQGTFFKGTFTLDNIGDTYFDMSHYTNGFVAVNGHNLGRFWKRGPQKRLYCLAPWLVKGKNEILVFDM